MILCQDLFVRSLLPLLAAILTVAFTAPTTAQECPAEYALCNFDQGNIEESGVLGGANSTLTGVVLDLDILGQPIVIDYNSFFLYDASVFDATFVAESASISFFATGNYISSASTETIVLYDMDDTTIDFVSGNLVDPFDPVSAHLDLQTGDQYGSYEIATPDATGSIAPFTISLNSAGIDDLNAAIASQSTFGVGAHLPSAAGSFEFVNVAINIPGSGVTLQSVPEVSATGALAAVGSLLAMMAFLWERRRVQSVLT